MEVLQSALKRCLGDELRRLREGRRLNQEKAAGLVHGGQSYVSRCETARRDVTFVEVFEWCRAYGVRLEVFARAYERRVEGLEAEARKRAMPDLHKGLSGPRRVPNPFA